jgi:hypothetical protein
MQQEYSGHRIGMPPEQVAAAILKLAGRNPSIAPGGCLTL